MAAANHRDVKSNLHRYLRGRVVAEARRGVKNIGFSKVFHVKHFEKLGAAPECPLLANAEIAEDHVQDVFHVDPAGEATERTSRESQLLSQQIFAVWTPRSARCNAATTSSRARR